MGFNMAFFGLMGAFWLGLFSYLTLSGVESMSVDNMGEILLGIVFAGLAVLPIPIGIFGLGILAGLMIPHKKVIFNTTDQSPPEPSGEPDKKV